MADPKMNKWTPTTDLLTLRRMGKMSEELGELQSVAARVVIQGMDETDPGSGKANRARLQDEMADVQAQIGCTVLAFGFDQDYMARRTAQKMRQMAEWEALFAGDPIPPGECSAPDCDCEPGWCRQRVPAKFVRVPGANPSTPMNPVRYCPECGSIGPVRAGARDCCPDGNHAREVPQVIAEQARRGFDAAYGASPSQEYRCNVLFRDGSRCHGLTEAELRLHEGHIAQVWRVPVWPAAAGVAGEQKGASA